MGDAALARTVLTVVGNSPPTVIITAPTDNSVFNPGEIISFIGSADDLDGSIHTLSWSSSLDGTLSTEPSFDTSALSIGTHTITFSATDNDGAIASDQISLRINNPVSASIITPSGGSVFNPGETVSFEGGATDADGSVVTQLWSSSLDGDLSSDLSFDTSILSIGSHVITFTATDDDTATITAPADGSVFNPGETVSFVGSVTDADGSVATQLWSSSLDGDLSSDLSFDTSILSIGSHVITFTTTDDDGASATDQITLRINNPPIAIILSPDEDSIFNPDEIISFTGTTTDVDGFIATLSWSSGLDGTLSNEPSFDTSTLSIGTHTITFTVTDNNNATTTAQITIRINSPPTATILSPLDGSVYSQRDTAFFEGSGSDSDGTISAFEWTSNFDGVIGTTLSFSSSSLSVGFHTITLKVTDNDGSTDSAQINVNQTGYRVVWVSPSEGEEFKPDKRMIIKFEVYEGVTSGFVQDDSVAVRIFDSDMVEIHTAVYGDKSNDVRIDLQPDKHYITNYRVPDDAMGTYTIKAEFATDRPNSEFTTTFNVPISLSGLVNLAINTVTDLMTGLLT
jgi:hypothetical protein